MNMKDNINLDEIYTEQRNPLTMHIDEESTEGIIRLMNGEDAKVALAVEKEIPNIVKAVDLITEAIRGGGRLIYCGWVYLTQWNASLPSVQILQL